MPGEEGYPTYLASRLASFYERAGCAVCPGGEDRHGSITVVGAVSPPGGDFSEPVTQSTLRVTGALWALDSELAHRRHYPAINCQQSYTLYFDQLNPWFEENVDGRWEQRRQELTDLLQKDAELQEVVQLVGPDALQDADRLTLEVSRMVQETFLQQNALSEVDASCPLEKQFGMLELLLSFYRQASEALEDDVPLDDILSVPVRERLSRLHQVPPDEFAGRREELAGELRESFDRLTAGSQAR